MTGPVQRRLWRVLPTLLGITFVAFALARALAPGPLLLIADEALSALDVSLHAQMANLMADLRSSLDIACLFITHDLRLASPHHARAREGGALKIRRWAGRSYSRSAAIAHAILRRRTAAQKNRP